jgi:DnaJ-class molecular chaperone with C-terminal Zn finger domain
MPDTHLPDHYEVLQISPNADRETIERVFRHLANRYHPDNLESGNSEKFTELVNANAVLSDPEKRAQYDVQYENVRQERWRIFDQDSTQSEVVTDTRIRLAMLSLLYIARRNNARDAGVGTVELERTLGCGTAAVEFHLWYLRENGWVERLESGLMAITARGVDRLFDLGGPPRTGPHLLQPGDDAEHVQEGAA